MVVVVVVAGRVTEIQLGKVVTILLTLTDTFVDTSVKR